MPELPEVERGRRVADAVARGRCIEQVRCARDPIVFDGTAPAALKKALVGRRVRAVHRHGKYIWFALDARPWPLFHFGMTGAFEVPGSPSLALKSGPRTADAWPPRFAKIRLVFDDGAELVMTNARRLGRIRLRERPEAQPPVSELGFDPLVDPPSLPEFRALLSRRRGVLKALLLDQSFAAGVGNWVADEVLYQARLDPRRTADTLSPKEVQRLRARLLSVVETAVQANASSDRYPRGWLFHRRWGRRPDARAAGGRPVEFITVGGRTTAFVPEVQR